MVNVKDVKLGKNTRKSFAKINEVLEMPNLIEVQKNSYQWFLDEGLKEVFRDVSTITDYNGNLELNFVDYRFDEEPKYSVAECKERDVTYNVPLRVTARLNNTETGEIKESEIFMGDFPLMTDSGTFVINGAERVIVSQLVRSPGVYYSFDKDKTGKDLFKSTVIPNRGAWLEYEMDSNDVVYVRIDKNRKIPLTTFIRAIGLGTDDEIEEVFGPDERIKQTILQKDQTANREEALLEVYKKLRPGEPPTVDSAVTHLNNLFFDARRYDLSRFGRYKYNKKLGVGSRLAGHVLSRPVANPLTGEIMAEQGEFISFDRAMEIENAGVTEVFVNVEIKEFVTSAATGETTAKLEKCEVKIIGNGMVDISNFVDFDAKKLGINEKVLFSVLKEILEEKGCPRVAIADLTRDDLAEAVEDGFRHSVLVCMASSYDAGVFTPMEDYLNRLEHKAFQNRTVALVENASWAPSAIKAMKAHFEKMANITLVDKTVTIKTRLTDAYVKELEELADGIMQKF